MLCLFSATLECHAPWTWWMLLTETDQATWFAAWFTAAAFMGGLAVYWHSKRIERAQDAERQRVSRVHQALRLQEPLFRASKRLDWMWQHLGGIHKGQFPQVPDAAIRTWFIDSESIENALIDPTAFSEETAIRLIALIGNVRSINRALEGLVAEGPSLDGEYPALSEFEGIASQMIEKARSDADVLAGAMVAEVISRTASRHR